VERIEVGPLASSKRYNWGDIPAESGTIAKKFGVIE
jgi:hypothetical protein